MFTIAVPPVVRSRNSKACLLPSRSSQRLPILLVDDEVCDSGRARALLLLAREATTWRTAASGLRKRSLPPSADCRALLRARFLGVARTWTASIGPPWTSCLRSQLPGSPCCRREAAEGDKVQALPLSTVDYVTKPFGAEELALRGIRVAVGVSACMRGAQRLGRLTRLGDLNYRLRTVGAWSATRFKIPGSRRRSSSCSRCSPATAMGC